MMLRPGKLALRDCSSNTRFTLGAWHLAKRLNMSTRMCSTQQSSASLSHLSLSHTHTHTKNSLCGCYFTGWEDIQAAGCTGTPLAPLNKHKHYINLNSSILYNVDRKLNSSYVR